MGFLPKDIYFPKLEGPISNRMKFNEKRLSLGVLMTIWVWLLTLKLEMLTQTAKKFGSAYPMGARMMSGHTNFIIETKLLICR